MIAGGFFVEAMASSLAGGWRDIGSWIITTAVKHYYDDILVLCLPSM